MIKELISTDIFLILVGAFKVKVLPKRGNVASRREWSPRGLMFSTFDVQIELEFSTFEFFVFGRRKNP